MGDIITGGGWYVRRDKKVVPVKFNGESFTSYGYAYGPNGFLFDEPEQPEDIVRKATVPEVVFGRASK